VTAKPKSDLIEGIIQGSKSATSGNILPNTSAPEAELVVEPTGWVG
jgi:hypothetical protein